MESTFQQQIAEQLDYYGSYFDVNIDRDYAYISFCTLSKFFGQTLAVAEQVLLHPTFPEEELRTYCAKRKQRLAIERTKVDVEAREAFARTMFGPEHPYGISADENDYDHLTPDEMRATLAANVRSANIPSMVVTMGGQGAVYAKHTGECGVVPAKKVDVIDTTGAGDAFFAGTVIGLTYGKNLAQSCEIGSRLAASVICITENVCPRFRPLEFGLDVPVVD